MDFFKIKKHEFHAFLAAIITAFIAYGYRITHNLLTYDSLWNVYSDQNMITSGRQFLKYACRISSDYALPWLNGLLAFFYLALTAILLVRIFDVKKSITAILIGVMLVSFPSVSNTFAYFYTVDGYMLAVLIATLSVYLASKLKLGFILGSILLCLSIGIYQAYFSYVMVLFIVLIFMDIIFLDSIKDMLMKMLRFGLTTVLGYVFYVVSLKIMLSVQGATLSGYQGTDKVTSFGSIDIFTGIKTAFNSFKEFAMYANVLTTTWPMKIAFVVVMLVCAAEIVFLLITKKRYKNWYRIALILLLALITPICATIFVVIAPETVMHLLMRMSWVVFFILAAVLGEKILSEHKWQKVVINTGYASLFVLAFEFALVSNIIGFNMNERYEKTYAMSMRIINELEEQPEYRHGMKVAILGGFPSEEIYPGTDITRKDLIGYFGTDSDYCANSTAKYAEFMKHYLGVTITQISLEEEIKLTETEEFANMEYFPYEGSVKKIGDVFVVKLNG